MKRFLFFLALAIITAAMTYAQKTYYCMSKKIGQPSFYLTIQGTRCFVSDEAGRAVTKDTLMMSGTPFDRGEHVFKTKTSQKQTIYRFSSDYTQLRVTKGKEEYAYSCILRNSKGLVRETCARCNGSGIIVKDGKVNSCSSCGGKGFKMKQK
jgi:hypothetical protein